MTTPLHERLAQLAAKAAVVAPGAWSAEQNEVYEEGCDIHPVASFSSNSNCRSMEDEELLAQFCADASPANVAKLCEQVRVLLGAVQAVEDFISGKPGAPEPFGMTRDALRLVKGNP